jgi:hypothetical protein
MKPFTEISMIITDLSEFNCPMLCSEKSMAETVRFSVDIPRRRSVANKSIEKWLSTPVDLGGKKGSNFLICKA